MWLSGVGHPGRAPRGLVGLTVIGLIAGTLTATGCIPRKRPIGATPGVAAPVETPAFTLTALPAYRLVVSPAVADLPSRLMVIQLRLASLNDALLQFTPEDLTLTLPNGSHGRVFDRARAVELLRRTTLAEADPSYRQQAENPSGGISESVAPQLAEMVSGNLLADGVFGGGQVLEGYLVVDTGEPLPTFDGVSIEVVAHRLTDATPTRYAYRFARTPATTEAQ